LPLWKTTVSKLDGVRFRTSEAEVRRGRVRARMDVRRTIMALWRVIASLGGR
jgi:hypothetical protein